MTTEIDHLKNILQLDNDLNRIQDLDNLLERILSAARQATNADAGSIYIRQGNELAIKFAQNDTKQKGLPPGRKLIYSIYHVPISHETVSGYAAETGEIVNISDAYNLPADAPYRFDSRYDDEAGYRTQSSLTIPLKTNMGEILGVLQIINAKSAGGSPRPFNDDDELFVTHFAANATLALQRAVITRTILLRMISMAELRDPRETGRHVNRVAGYAVEIYEQYAKNKGLPPDQIDKECDILRMAAMLHDVGKVAISDTILKKPGHFSREEFMIMSAHTYLGARLFLNRQSILDEVAADVALMHHENWDGTGYPGFVDLETGRTVGADENSPARGRKGEEISIWGRVVAVADVYDALSSVRVYKEAWAENEVLEEMRKLRGTKFDPQLLDVFFKVLPNIRQITKRYQDRDADVMET